MSNKAGSTSKPAAMVAPKSTPPKQSTPSANSAQANKMHKRSRSGCFTCRLRRKKCDEGKGLCSACKHLGLKCEYKRPIWWSNNEQRRMQKENIKNIIKRTKLTEKTSKEAAAAVAAAGQSGAESPPGLTHSLPTSATYSDTRNRATSEDSNISFEFNQAPTQDQFDVYAPQVYTPQFEHHPYSTYPPTPYEVDIKTERQMYVNGEPTRRDSTISNFTTYHPPPPGTLAPVPEDGWEDIYETPDGMFAADSQFEDLGYFDFQHPPSSDQNLIQVDECDRPLLEHFISSVLRLIFPVLEANPTGTSSADVILPALETNKCYLHCCLSIAAIHLKSTLATPDEQLDADIVRHRYATISELCEALNRDENHSQILEATLGMIFFSCTVGRPDDALPDIPWHQHFQAAASLVNKLQLPDTLLKLPETGPTPPPFNMSLTAWIDIFGATMIGRAPQFANTYREMHMSSRTTGLHELMGCEDKMMYLISEIACLEALKLSGAIDETLLCNHITMLAKQIDPLEISLEELATPAVVDERGVVRPRVLGRNMTALFRKAARIWLLSLIPGMTRSSAALFALVQQFTELLAYVPTGAGGYDRCIVWPLLMVGAQSTSNSSLRQVLEERVQCMGETAELGAFGRMRRLLSEVWAANDAVEGADDEAARSVHWRDVMQSRGWDFLLL